MTEEFLTRKDISIRLKTSVRNVDKWIKNKKIKSLKIGGLVRVTKSSFDEFIKTTEV